MTTAFRATFPPSAQPQAFEPLFPTGSEAFSAVSWEQPQASAPPLTPDDILAAAHAEAKRLLGDAEARATELVAAQVQQTAQTVRQEQVEAFSLASEALLGSLERHWETRLEAVEKEMALLLASLLERLVHQQIAADDQAIVSLVRAALQRLTDSERVQIVIAPQHEPALRQAHDDLVAVLRDDARLEIVAADSAEAAGCVVHGDRDSVDARLSTRLEAIDQVIQQTVLGDAAA